MSSGPLVVLAALRQELAALEPHVEDRRDGSVILAATGIGKVNAAVTTTQVVTAHRPRALVVVGVAGAVDPALRVGDLVVADRSIQHDAGLVENGELDIYQAGHVPFFNPTDRLGWETTPTLREAALHAAQTARLEPIPSDLGGRDRRPSVLVGPVATGDQFVACRTTRERIRRSVGALVVEMEGAAIAQTAERLGVGHVLVRSVSDMADPESPGDFARTLPLLAHNLAQVVLELLPRI
jgi:adenosylhomocysteine nucleosidase